MGRVKINKTLEVEIELSLSNQASAADLLEALDCFQEGSMVTVKMTSPGPQGAADDRCKLYFKGTGI